MAAIPLSAVLLVAFVAVSLWHSGSQAADLPGGSNIEGVTAHTPTTLPASAVNATLQAELGARRMLKQKRGHSFWSVRASEFVDAQGRIVKFAGVQWGGIETDGAPHGLWVRSYGSMLDQMKSLGFNMVRLSFSGESLKPYTYPSGIGINFGLNPDLQGQTCLEIMDKIIGACAYRGMKVVLDYHRVNFTDVNEGGMWWDIYQPESTWISNWVMLASRYAGQTTVLGADLFNEVHGNSNLPSPKFPVWAPDGVDEPYNFRTACFRAASAIQKVNKDWLIFVEGMWQNDWWGGNLELVKKYPMNALPVPHKLAYSNHEYGPYVYWQGYFNSSKFPNNLERIWNVHFGYLVTENRKPLWVGEWGGFYNVGSTSRIDKVENKWITLFTRYIRTHQLSHTWFNWGPDSRDTGGILLDDWTSVDQNKMALLQGVLHPGYGPSKGQNFAALRKKISGK